MNAQYSRMTEEALREEIKELRVAAQKAEAKGMINEYAVHERKILMAEAYLLDPADYEAGAVYSMKDDPAETFEINYMNGVFAWGYRNSGKKLEAVPISVLGNKLSQGEG
ncbi:YfhH family protein [Alkalicoccus chagannorensis]|uniref:YfhH family protein n=1 Tax=Alkalicoccus chagannorensis TaxID=427072 RepID=UPI00042890AE|nr:YfhH family protein [Alkalicoccus chagannorensis]